MRQAEILRTIAAKYGITPITARWYYHSVALPRRSSRRRATRKNLSKFRHTHQHPANGTALKIVHHLQTVAENSIKKGSEAKKLIPKWQVYVKKEASLRKLEKEVRFELRAISAKATALHRKIRELTGN